MENKDHIYITITGRENSTWQGILRKGEDSIPFYSELELLSLIEEQLKDGGDPIICVRM